MNKILVTFLASAAGCVAAFGQQTAPTASMPRGAPDAGAQPKAHRSTNSAPADGNLSDRDHRNGAGTTRVVDTATGARTGAGDESGAVQVDLTRRGPGDPIKVTQPAPQLPFEVRAPSPGPQYVWVPGSYVWKDRNWHWVAGRWVVPPQTGLAWYPGTVDVRDMAWIPGYWGPDPNPEPSAVVDALPPP